MNWVHWILWGYASFNVSYLFLLVLARKEWGHLSNRLLPFRPKGFVRIALLFPAYKEDAVIVDSVLDVFKQEYPKDFFEVVVIADSLQGETLRRLSELPIRLVEVSFQESTKSKSINHALSLLPDAYDVALVLDADNKLCPNFLQQLNDAFAQGIKAVQGHRVAKNNEGNIAYLDCLSEEINNSLFREFHRRWGLSAALIGSGMAFNYALFKRLMGSIKAVGGFDKELELKLLQERQTIEYLPHALIYDEKVASRKNLAHQRRRWIAAQWHYLYRYFPQGWRELLRGNVDYFDKVLQFSLLPRALAVSLFAFLSLLFYGIGESGYAVMWGILCLFLVIVLVVSIPRYLFNFRMLKALISLPVAIGGLLQAVLQLRGGNKTFLHTPHSLTTSSSRTNV